MVTIVTTRHEWICGVLRRVALRRWHALACALALVVASPILDVEIAGAPLGTTAAFAQGRLTYNPRPPREAAKRAPQQAQKNAAGNDGQMLVQADQIDYDYNNQQVGAVGRVQIYYRNTTLEADRVTYDQKNKRLNARGNVRMTDADGRITQLGPDVLPAGDYRLEFAVGAYFRSAGRTSFYPRVTIDFIVTDVDAHYHVPVLLSPFAYSTYRGS